MAIYNLWKMKIAPMSSTLAVDTWLTIGAVERDTGLGRDTLRVWERRYGFPTPSRNGKGERVYGQDQVRRLQLIRRLLDQGLRPGKVVPLDEEKLSRLAESLPPASKSAKYAEVGQASLISLASAGDLAGLSAALEQALAREGLRGFVLGTFVPLIGAIGERWAGGRLQIFEEHMITGQLVRFLETALGRFGRPPGRPEILLATLPGERHALGLLMAEALLWVSGRVTLNLGADVPMDQIVAAAERTGVDVVALSFSASYPRGPIRANLEELAGRLPQGVAVWVGGEGVRRLPRLPPSVERMALESL